MLVNQSGKIKELEDNLLSVLQGTRKISRKFCEGCFEKQIKIDLLEEEIKSFKAQLKYREHKEKDGYFGTSTPSSQKPYKENSLEENRKKRGGVKVGHQGHGRKVIEEKEAERIEKVTIERICPDCGGEVESKGYDDRFLINLPPIKIEKVIQKLEHGICSECGGNVSAKARGVFPRWLYGNRVLSQTIQFHYFLGIPLGRVRHTIGMDTDHLFSFFHRLADLLESVVQKLIEVYRLSPVKHADETGWRIDGKSGYAWILCNKKHTIFRFRDRRLATVAHDVFGKQPLPGTLVVDRYDGYNKIPCKIQYCYEHLKRDVEELAKEFPDSKEVKDFV